MRVHTAAPHCRLLFVGAPPARIVSIGEKARARGTRRRRLGAGPPPRHPADPRRQRPRRRCLLRRPRADGIAPRGAGRGDAGDRHEPRGHPRADRRRRDRPPGAAAQPRRPGPGDPAHRGEPDARQGHGARGAEARRGGVLDGREGRAHRGALPAPARRARSSREPALPAPHPPPPVSQAALARPADRLAPAPWSSRRRRAPSRGWSSRPWTASSSGATSRCSS